MPSITAATAWKFEAVSITDAGATDRAAGIEYADGTAFRDGIQIDPTVRFTGRTAFSVGPEVLRRAGAATLVQIGA